MATKLIKLDDGLLVEVETGEGAPQRIAASGVKKVSQALDQVQDLLRKAVTPLTAAIDTGRTPVGLPQLALRG